MADMDPATLDRYRRDGVVVVEGLLDDLTRQKMKQALADLIEQSRRVSTHTDVYDLEPGHSPQNPRVRRIKKPHLVHPVFAEFMRSPRLLAVLSALLGPSGVRLNTSKLNLKSPHYGSPVEWHQDWGVLPAHQRRHPCSGCLAGRRNTGQRPPAGTAGQPPWTHLRPPRQRWPILRGHGTSARST